MKLASQVDPHGISASMELRQDILSVIMEYRPHSIIETGTYKGLGSTSAVLHGLADANIRGFSFISIESNKQFYQEAVNNLDPDSNQYKGSLLLLNAISLPLAELPTKVEYDFDDSVIVDHINPNSYLKEIPKDVKDDGLMTALHLVNFRPDLVILDSAGHLGTQEFIYLMANVDSPFTLILDDTNHIKHYKTMQMVRKNKRYNIIKESNDKFGHAIIEVKERVCE